MPENRGQKNSKNYEIQAGDLYNSHETISVALKNVTVVCLGVK